MGIQFLEKIINDYSEAKLITILQNYSGKNKECCVYKVIRCNWTVQSVDL